ncbi:MAG TPA: GldG family protein [Burkholderiales bacterium]|nr:GldG family protein [Burkholderiales bacterium]
MKLNRKLRLQLLLQNGLFVVLLLGVAAAVAWVTRDVKIQWDLTQSQRNTLSQASVEALQQMAGQITVTAYATAQDAEGDVRKTVQTFLSPYQRAKRDFMLVFVDPREQPQKTQAAGVRVNGELVIEYNGRNEHLTNLSEMELTNLLVRLARSSERQVMSLDGHGERKLDGRANHDLGEFGNQLSAKGFKIAALNLAQAQDVPDNLSVLIIAGPRVDLLPGETGKIRRWMEKGGNLLWLIDNDSLRGLQVLAEELGLNLTWGTVVDPRAGGLNLPATFALASGYGPHRITENSSITSVFPYARRIAAKEGTKWRFQPLVEAAQSGWLETGGINDKVAFDRDRDVRGPIVVAAALERDLGNRKQRVVVTGTGQFLANQYVGLLGNLDLGVNMVNWLAGDESLITVQPRTRSDLSLELSRAGLALIGIGFLVVLPLVFLVAGGAIWWRRRKA